MTKTYRISEEQREELKRLANKTDSQLFLNEQPTALEAIRSLLDALVPDSPPAGAAKWRIGDRVVHRDGSDLRTGVVSQHFVELATMSGGQVVAEDSLETLAERAARLRQEAATCEAEAEKGRKE